MPPSAACWKNRLVTIAAPHLAVHAGSRRGTSAQASSPGLLQGDLGSTAPDILLVRYIPLLTFSRQAKDTFYSCVDFSGKPFTAGTIPEGCQKQRSEFEAACKASWVGDPGNMNPGYCLFSLVIETGLQLQVSHFDQLKDKDTRLIQTLHKNINISASKGQLKGQLSGQPSTPASDSKQT